jgi:hypothetical protein
MALLNRDEFYQRLGHALKQARLERGLSQEEAAEGLNQTPIDLERCLRRIAAMSVMAASIRRRKSLSRKPPLESQLADACNSGPVSQPIAHVVRRRPAASDRSAQTQPPTALPQPAPMTAHYNPNRFTHATSPPQPQYSEKVWLLPRVPSRC